MSYPLVKLTNQTRWNSIQFIYSINPIVIDGSDSIYLNFSKWDIFNTTMQQKL